MSIGRPEPAQDGLSGGGFFGADVRRRSGLICVPPKGPGDFGPLHENIARAEAGAR